MQAGVFEQKVGGLDAYVAFDYPACFGLTALATL